MIAPDVGGLAVAQGVDIDLDRVLEEPIDERRPVHAVKCLDDLFLGMADAHRAPAEHVRGPHEHRVADPARGLGRLDSGARDPPVRAANSELREQLAEALAVLREIDRVERRPEDRETGRLDRPCELERCLAAELDHDTGRLLPLADREHRFRVERLEVETVGGVVVGRHRLRVAVDHHRLVAELAIGLDRVHAAVVELDALPDPVRPRAEDHHAFALAERSALVLLAPGCVVVVRRRLDLAGDGVDPTVDRRQRALALLLGCEPGELVPEPRMQALGLPLEVSLEPALRLHERLDEGAADAHRLADGLHLSPERRVGVRELLECEARDLHDDIVERRLEARGRGSGEVVGDLVERVADRKLRRDLGDRIAGRFRREGGRARDAWVHLDHANVAGDPVARELDVRPARVDPHRTNHRDGRVTQLLVGLVAERHLRCDGDGVAGVHAHRIEVLDRTDDHDVVGVVAHDFELELVPAAHRLLDQHLADR